MGKALNYFTSIYRFLIIAVVIKEHIEAVSFNYEKEHLMLYSSFVLYGCLFSVFKRNKFAAFLETILIFIFMQMNPVILLYFLLLIPFGVIIASMANKFDLILYGFLVTAYIAFQYNLTLFHAFMAYAGLEVVLFTLHAKFYYIEHLETELFQAKNAIQESKKQVTGLNEELNIVADMFNKIRELNEADDKEIIIEQIVHSARDFFQADLAVLYLPKGDGFEVFKQVGKEERYTAPRTLTQQDLNESPFGNERLQVGIYDDDKERNRDVWGVLRVYGKRASVFKDGQLMIAPFTDIDLEILATYAQQAHKRLSHVKLAQKNKYLANYDFLTGVPLRRHFIEQFQLYAEKAMRGDAFTLLILDVDDFKLFNDRHGHHVGDQVLKIVAETISNSVRKPGKVDIVGRLGGEEFGVILYNSKDPAVAAERIRKNVNLVPTGYDRIGLSIGMAHFGKDGTDWNVLSKKADRALYLAKERGKNQVVEWEEVEEKE
ncbi:GGDEF domain-containing protein (plasmid) [Pontibacillus sp. ALD_SL1]|uniref:sensor domain-containing diguanylate cyclase n=1 Tax=Pontibacillus sp. ALD_SL1 TaxID=2777185 RepID=UPI001A96A0D3|nr:sensor domain-containing diguanylate cyclase [Pontibacillus sp. ALD_SL1]QST03077.1 GGDEF domain-containing protein [Pontibacillus sp. ALD_SL1]